MVRPNVGRVPFTVNDYRFVESTRKLPRQLLNIVARVVAMLSMCRNVLMFRPPPAAVPTTLIYSPLEIIIRQLPPSGASPLVVTVLVLLKLRTVSPSTALSLLPDVTILLSMSRRLLITLSVVQHPLILLRNGPLACRMHVACRL